MGQPSAKRAKSNAGTMIQTTPPMQMTGIGKGTTGEHIVVHDDVCSVVFDSLEADKPCSADSNTLETGEEDSVNANEVDPRLEGMHSLEVNEMLDNEVDGEHYEIKWHYFREGKLLLVVHDSISGLNITVKAEDNQLDFRHALASFIHAKQFSTDNAKPWVQWADRHFKRVRRLIRRLE